MSGGAPYTPYHPKWYRRRVSVWWWLENWSSTKFLLRELTSVFVAFFAVVSLWQLRALGQGPEAYAHFFVRLKTPLFLTLHSLALVFVLYHALTWFHLAPKALVLRLRGTRVPDAVIVAMNYLAWVVVSAVVAWLVLGA